MRGPETFGEIRRLLDEERFAEAQELLAPLTQNSLDEPESVGDMHNFVKSAVLTLKARRVHYIEELQTLEHRKAYFSSVAPPRTHSFDLTG